MHTHTHTLLPVDISVQAQHTHIHNTPSIQTVQLKGGHGSANTHTTHTIQP